MESLPDGETPVIRQLSTRLVYENPWLSVREDRIERPDGSAGIYSVVDRPDYAVVIASENDGFHLVDQYRYPISGRYWEFPQGCFPYPKTGTPEELARAELAEETGLRAGKLVALGRLFGWQGASGQAFTSFLATELVQGETAREHEEQDMRHRWVTRAEFERMITGGAIMDNSTVAAYALLQLHERIPDC
ncbi:NUDIX hydrolase [Amycolatopsis sp. H20-H5]|uniref:NUDIX hydrolase n=1 Tax=Amycolatopsis sp. H20-H5 TaxID=3046309 RepID=UPI002DBF57F8|nr:NUDIX hydrolase [Amycolatopsis sp. H20-H5]MEC3976908.1 NUDIX hydrolase [Amycolatopsis sp. H20-H5]